MKSLYQCLIETLSIAYLTHPCSYRMEAGQADETEYRELGKDFYQVYTFISTRHKIFPGVRWIGKGKDCV